MDRDFLLDFRLGKLEQNLNVYGIVVKQHGETIADYRFRSNDFVQMYSVSKTFTAMAVGLAIDEGYFNLEDKIVDLFSDVKKTSQNELLAKLTVKHLLTMSTGQQMDSLPVHFIEEPFLYNWEEAFFSIPIVHEPGSVFMYNNGATYMLSSLIQRKTGLKLRDYLMPRIFDPLNIFNPQWDSCPKGVNKGYIGLHLTTEQMSRMGQLLLNEGVWEGKQILPRDYVKMATSKQIDNTYNWSDPEVQQGYGFQIWQNTVPNSYRLDGLYGQFCIVLPEYDSVIAITSHEEINQNGIIRLVWDTILPKLKKSH